MSSKRASIPLRLDRYIAILALDPARMEAFLTRPKEQLEALGFQEHERTLMLNEGVQDLFEHLYHLGIDIKPLPSEQPGDGTA